MESCPTVYLLPAQRSADAFKLFEMRPFMVCQPLGIRAHGPLTRLPAPVTVATRYQATGGNGANTANSSARWAVKACKED
jgi:hypothetical protein